MGNLCVQKDKYETSSVSSQKQRNLKSSVKTEDHENFDSGNSEVVAKDFSYTAKMKIENSFNKKNEIGAYFCGGSIQEQNAISYTQRLQDFDTIMKKGKKETKKKQKKIKKSDSNNMNQDMERTFTQKFDFLPFLAVNHKELQRCIKKGPPIRYRWDSWKSHMIQFSEINLEDCLKLFKSYMLNESKEEVQIEKDINRTFPSQKYFATTNIIHNQRDNHTINGYQPLKRVLVSISNMYPDLGYCQGMNFIMGFILMINGAREEEAFWMFKVLAEHPDFMLMGLYENDLPLLKFLEYVAKKVLTENCKELIEFFDQNDIPDSFWLTKWILTLFLYNFPVKICSRFWDYLLTNDIFSLIKLFIPILDIFKKEFMSHDDACSFMECFTVLCQDEAKLTDPQSEFYLNINEIVKKADSYKIEKKTIAKYACQYLKYHESNNEYAQLYSVYDQKTEFRLQHTKLVTSKIKQPCELQTVPEEKDNNESSTSITKQDLPIYRKSEVEGSEVIKTQSIKLVKGEQTVSNLLDSTKTQDTKTPINQGEMSNLETAVDFTGKNSGTSPKKFQNPDDSKEDDKQNSQSGNFTELPSNRHISQLKMYPQLQENPENSVNHGDETHISLDEQDDYSDEGDDQFPNEQLKMEKKESSTRHFKKSKTVIHDHQDAVTFDRESYNMFQSLMNKSIDTSIHKRSSIGFHKSIDPSDTEDQAQFSVMEEEVENEETQRQNFQQNKPQIQISALSSQCDLSKTDTLIYVKKTMNQALCSSTLSDEKNNQNEMLKIQMS